MSKIGLINGGVIVQGNDNIFPYEQLDTTWNDLRFPVSGLATGPTKQPTLAMWNDNGSGSDGIFLRSFANDEHMFLAGQMSHEWKSGTIIFPHFHIMASDANVGDINFGIEYSWININDTADVNTTITERTIATPFVGASTGSALTTFRRLLITVGFTRVSSTISTCLPNSAVLIFPTTSSSKELIWLFASISIATILLRSSLFFILSSLASSYILIFAIHPPYIPV